MNNNLPAFSAALASYHVSEAVPGLAHGVFHVQQNFPASSIDAVMSALASAVDNKMEVQRDSFRRFNNDKYSFVASVVMAAKDEVQELPRVPQSFVAVAKNMYMNLEDQTMYDAEAIAGGKIRLTRKSSLESVEAINELLAARKKPLSATASSGRKAQAIASVSKLGRGVLTSYLDPRDLRLQIGFIVDAKAAGAPNIGNTMVSIASMSTNQMVPVQVPAFMLVEQICASRFRDGLRHPAQKAVASAEAEDQMSYYNTLGSLNRELFDRWLEICRERDISIPMME